MSDALSGLLGATKSGIFQNFALWMLTRLAISILKIFIMFATVYWRILHATKIIFMTLFAGRAVIDAAQTLINEPPKAGRPGYLKSSARKREIPFSTRFANAVLLSVLQQKLLPTTITIQGIFGISFAIAATRDWAASKTGKIICTMRLPIWKSATNSTNSRNYTIY